MIRNDESPFEETLNDLFKEMVEYMKLKDGLEKEVGKTIGHLTLIHGSGRS